MKDKVPLDGERLAKEVSDFLGSPLGEHLLKALALQYNNLHHQAEDEALSTERKAMKVERAAGVKWTLDYLTERKRLLSEGYFDKGEKKT